MENGKEPQTVTKSGLLGIAIITLTLVAILFYAMYKTGAASFDLIGVLVCSIAGIALISFAVFAGIRMRGANYKRLEAVYEDKAYKGIRYFAIATLLLASVTGSDSMLLMLNKVGLLVVSIGLFFVKKWGRYMFIFLATLAALLISTDILLHTIQIVINPDFLPNLTAGKIAVFFMFRPLVLAFFISGIFYFTRTKVKELFK